MKLYIGLMSGTSMDGIDAALVDVTNHQLIAGLTRPYSEEARRCLNVVISKKEHTLASISALNTKLGIEFAEAAVALLRQSQVPISDVIAIGSHGQTIAHDTQANTPYTIQLGCPHTISALTGMTVVADFRTRDIVNGGQGAPYAPLYHQALFGHLNETIAIINIGGIANITCLTPGKKISGYDIGPGNCLMDWWAQKNLGKAYDEHGDWAASGKVISDLLSTLLNDPYFKGNAPKSIGKEYFSGDWLLNKISPSYLPEDVQATLLALTVTSIATAIEQYQVDFQQVLLCGGGVHNQALFKALRTRLPKLKVDSTASLKVSPDYLEAMMFAWLADKALARVACDLSHITGAKKQAILGAIYPK